jgi:RHH-type proline utilization regulon transcriptional repressor/proline dehydrogenase/delta 1-pyrroline-5-carboxylate dehydrogenase
VVRAAVGRADSVFPAWTRHSAEERAGLLEAAAGLFEREHLALISLIVREGGRTLVDAHSEVREAVDFLRYYAARARLEFGKPARLPGPTGERNTLTLSGRGVFACISPWNFPLAIFTGQIAAALAAGNTVVAKPAEQTPLIGMRAVALLHEAGIPDDALILVSGPGETVGAALSADPRIAGIAFTGSTATAKLIQRALAGNDRPIVPFIAETGGINAMIVDSSALIEQVVRDVLVSAFNSAGQRCSALRVLYIQHDIADAFEETLGGAMAELRIGDPADPATDIGPVIDGEAHHMLALEAESLLRQGRLIARTPMPGGLERGYYVAPLALELPLEASPTHEIFGPILPIVRYDADELDSVLARIRATGYGLTLGIHSRIGAFQHRISEALAIGNVYVNRSMIGAVVGVQPFGGNGLSGTGPKAGGPYYLHRFARETTLSINTAAIGGDVALMAGEGGRAPT